MSMNHDADSNLKVLFYLRSIDYCQCRRTGALGPRHGTGILFGTQSSFCGFTHTLHQRSRSSGRRTTDKPDPASRPVLLRAPLAAEPPRVATRISMAISQIYGDAGQISRGLHPARRHRHQTSPTTPSSRAKESRVAQTLIVRTCEHAGAAARQRQQNETARLASGASSPY